MIRKHRFCEWSTQALYGFTYMSSSCWFGHFTDGYSTLQLAHNSLLGLRVCL